MKGNKDLDPNYICIRVSNVEAMWLQNTIRLLQDEKINLSPRTQLRLKRLEELREILFDSLYNQ
jgi:hypothetical protein